MAVSKRDEQRVPTLIGVDSATGLIPTLVEVDATTGEVLVKSSSTPVSADDFEGSPVTVGTTAVELTFTGTTKSILIQSDPDNTGKIWIGKSNVTSAGANAMIQLKAGEAIELDLDDSSNAIYAVSDTASQVVHKMALV